MNTSASALTISRRQRRTARSLLGSPVAARLHAAARHLRPPAALLLRYRAAGFGLAGTYAVWLVSIALLYWPCKRYAAFKARSTRTWVSYL